jgi:uncharacterized protein
MTPTEHNKALVNRFFDDLNAGNTEAVIATYSDDGLLETMGSTLISGTFDRDQLSTAIERIFTVFPDGLQFTVFDMVAEGDKVAVEAACSGEHVSGQTYENSYHFLFEFRDGKLARLREYMDTEQVTDVLCGGQRPPFGGE